MQVVDLKMGAEGDAELDIAAGNLVIKVQENTPGFQGAVNLNVPLTYFVDALAAKLGGTPTELAVAAMIDSVLKGLA